MGIEPTMPLLAQSIIGFEDRGRHQSGTRFRARYHTASEVRQASSIHEHARAAACRHAEVSQTERTSSRVGGCASCFLELGDGLRFAARIHEALIDGGHCGVD